MLTNDVLGGFNDWQWVFEAHSQGHETRLERGQVTALAITSHKQLKFSFAWTAFQEAVGQPWVAAALNISPPLGHEASLSFVGPGHFRFDSGQGFLADVYGPFHKQRVNPAEVLGLVKATAQA